MSRQATITFAEVEQIANNLVKDGVKPTVRLILERHGSGSLGTITPLFRMWTDAKTKNSTEGLALPTTVQRAILDLVATERTSAIAILQTQLTDAEEANNELSRDNTALIDETEEQRVRIQQLRESAAKREGEHEVLQNELIEVKTHLIHAREIAEKTRIELEKNQMRIQEFQKIELERDQLLTDLRKTNDLRENAMRELAVAGSSLNELEKRFTEIKQQKLESDLQLAKVLQDLREEANKSGQLQGLLDAKDTHKNRG
ncbi:MAG: DNA-binding protein [Candidatus Saccharibacteria bacterium]|nr:DNA-binding protein [Candidatus Saccharibacteria bacterium]